MTNAPQSGSPSDVFISYAILDNSPLGGSTEGWVSRFHNDLVIKLSELMGERVKVWRDAKLGGSDLLEETIIRQFPTLKALLSVVSPRYLRSEWCVREVGEFEKASAATGGVKVNEKSRFFKVVKTPFAAQDVPPSLVELFNSVLGFDFFEVDPASGRPREFSEEYGQEARRKYFARLYDVAYDLSQLLKLMRTHPLAGARPAEAPRSGKTVYLALTASDLQAQREQVRRELVERGHAVLPDSPLPMISEEFEAAVRACLERCDLAIHLVGERYGIVPENASQSIVELQNQLAAAATGKPGYSRLIWLPKGLTPQDPRQVEFVERLQRDAQAQHGAELIQDVLEKLKEVMLDKLTPPPPPVSPVKPDPQRPPLLYLICDQADDLRVDPLEDFFFDQGAEVSRSRFEGDEAAISQAHRQALQLCDAVLIYYGAASRAWVDVKLMDVLQAPGYGRSAPPKAQAVALAPPDNRDKQRFRTRTAETIRLPEPFSGESLRPFLQQFMTSP
jgi:hypothetical protein